MATFEQTPLFERSTSTMESGLQGRIPLGLTQSDLDLADRPGRTNALPWRGQFNPILVKNLLREFGDGRRVICDPFAGSGTVLFESLRAGKDAIGFEINPAGIELAAFATLTSRSRTDQSRAFDELTGSVSKLTDVGRPEIITLDLGSRGVQDLRKTARDLSRIARPLFGAALLLTAKNKKQFDSNELLISVQKLEQIRGQLPEGSASAIMGLSDARNLPLEGDVVDLVVTSPPYINVFNYHHHYRSAVEALGWDVLLSARSEVGSNRKNRSNRFLTVVQYCLDIAMTFDELMRVLRPGNPIVMIVGRESNVLGTPFFNAALVNQIAREVSGLRLESAGERRFRNRFGKLIYEDVLVFRQDGKSSGRELDGARQIGVSELQTARSRCPRDRIELLDEALEKAGSVAPSPMLPRFDQYPSGQKFLCSYGDSLRSA